MAPEFSKCPIKAPCGWSSSLKSRWAVRCGASCLVLLALHLTWNLYSHTGLFIALSSDYGLYISQALVLQEDNPVHIYDRVAIDRQYKPC